MNDPAFAALFLGLTASVVTWLIWTGVVQLRTGDWDGGAWNLVLAACLAAVVLLNRWATSPG